MEIGILGCDHAFGTGEYALELLYGANLNNKDVYEDLSSLGYSAILSSLYPQHTFEVIPTLDGGNENITNTLISYITEKPKDMYIVQFTQWHRVTIGQFFYKKKTFNITDNFNYTLYDIKSYHGVKYKKVKHPHLPNLGMSYIPGQLLGAQYKGTGTTPWVFNDDHAPHGTENIKVFFDYVGAVMKHDHIPSYLHMTNLYSYYNLINYLSKKENIWYFFWNPPFGTAHDARDHISIGKDKFLETQGFLYSKLMNKNHENLILKKSISELLQLSDESYVDDMGHIPNEAHEHIVHNLLLKNSKFKEALDG